MLCLSGLLACSKDKTEDVPPVPPGSEEIPDKLELKAGDTDFNSLAYTVTAGKDGNEYLHVVYDKSFYDGVVGVFYQPADLLQKDGIIQSKTLSKVSASIALIIKSFRL